MSNTTNLEASSTSAPLYGSTDLLAVTGRILVAAIFLLSGFSKLTDPAASIGYIQSAGLPLPKLALGVAILVELVGGILLVAGYRVRAVALVLASFTLITALGFHFQLADQNQFLHFFKNLAMAGGLLQIAAFGGGRHSIGAAR